jgi:hypothetical protein
MLKSGKYVAIAIVGVALAAAANAPASARGYRGGAYGYEGGGGGETEYFGPRERCADSFRCLRKAHRALRMWTYDRVGHVPRDRVLAEMAERIPQYYGRR